MNFRPEAPLSSKTSEYIAPEIFELGNVEDLTFGGEQSGNADSTTPWKNNYTYPC